MSVEMIAGYQVGLRCAGVGAPALLIHCALAHTGAFSPLMSCLDDQLAMTAFDLPGHGKTEIDPSQDYQDQAVEIAVQLLQRQSEPSHLIGHSFGATVAMRLAVEHPDKVKSLSIYEPVNFAIFANDDPEGFAKEKLDSQGFLDAVLQENWIVAASLFLDRWGGGESFDTLPEAQQNYILETLPTIMASEDSRISPSRGAKMRQSLTLLRIPVLIMEGANSPTPVNLNNNAIHKAIPHATRHIFAGAGHMGMITHASEVARLMQDTVL